jgi:membrane associated rhomboid family serine protease
VNTGLDNSDRGANRLDSPRNRKPVAVPVIVVINALIFLAWQAARFEPALLSMMEKNFLVSTTSVMSGRVWTLLTAAFSHIELWHIALNMLVLWSFGSVLERLWGTRIFSAFYLTAAVVASASHCLVSSLILGDPRISALGASGAVSGLLLAFALLFPRHRILVFGIIPVPALIGALAFVAIDLWGLFAQSRGGGVGIGHGAHLGGALCGFLFWLFYLRTRYQRPPAGTGVQMAMSAEEIQEFQRLRRKLDSEGPQALTPKEKVFLDDIRDRVMRTHQQR